MLPKKIDGWPLTSVQQRLVKTGGRLVKHARYYWLLFSETLLTWRVFGAMARRMVALPAPSGEASRPPDWISATREQSRLKCQRNRSEKRQVRILGPSREGGKVFSVVSAGAKR